MSKKIKYITKKTTVCVQKVITGLVPYETSTFGEKTKKGILNNILNLSNLWRPLNITSSMLSGVLA